MGTPIENTQAVVKEIELFMREALAATPDSPEGIVDWATFIGQGAPRFVSISTRSRQSPNTP